MSETSSDTNGESSFEFLTHKDERETKASEPLISMSAGIQSVMPTVMPSGMSSSVSPPMATSLVTPIATLVSTTNEHQSAEPSMPSVVATVDVPLDSNVESKSRSDSSGSGFLEWITSNEFISKVAEKAKNSMDTMITTLDPGMKEIIYSGGDINILVTSDKESKISPIREAFQKVFGRATISGMAAQSSSIASQPIGFLNGLKAAEERIKVLRMNTSIIPQNQVIVSLENFIVDITSDNWHDVGCIVLDDPVLGINLQIYTQSTPIPNECVNQMCFETPIDYPLKSNGYSVTVGQVMAQKLKVPHDKWYEHWVGIARRDIILEAANALANLYKNRMSR